jgi:hypothetical protein
MKGGFGLTGQSPIAACRSVWHTPLARTRISACPGPIFGTATSRISRGLPSPVTTAAFMVFGSDMAFSLSGPEEGCHCDDVSTLPWRNETAGLVEKRHRPSVAGRQQ